MFGKEFGRIDDDDEDLADFDFERAIEKQFSTSFLNPDDFDESARAAATAAAGDGHDEGSVEERSAALLQNDGRRTTFSLNKQANNGAASKPAGGSGPLFAGSGDERWPQDLAWAALWLANLAANVGLLIAGYATQPGAATSPGDYWWSALTANAERGFWRVFWPDVLVLLIAGVGLALLLTVGALLLLKSRAAPSLFLKPPAALLLAAAAVLCLLFLSKLDWPWALAWLAVACCAGAACWQLRARARFTAYLLELQASLLNMFPHTGYLATALLLPQLLIAALALLSVFSCSHWGLWPLPYLLFSYFWLTQVVVDVAYTVTCATAYSWYISGPPSDFTGSSRQITLAVFARVVRRAFGSICLAALVTPPLQLVLRPLMDFWRPGARSAAAQTLLRVGNAAFRRCNRYAYVNVGTHGHSFASASRNIWAAFEHHGFDRLLYEESVWMTSTALNVLVATACFTLGGALSFLIGVGIKSQLHQAVVVAVVVASLCFLVGLRLAALASAVLESGVAMLFVSFVDDPAQLRVNDANVFQRLSIEFSYRCPALFVEDAALEFSPSA